MIKHLKRVWMPPVSPVSDTIDCDVIVNGEVNGDKKSDGVNAQTFCSVTSA